MRIYKTIKWLWAMLFMVCLVVCPSGVAADRTNVVLVWHGWDPMSLGGTNTYQTMTVSNTLVWQTNVYKPSLFKLYSTTNLPVTQTVLDGKFIPLGKVGWELVLEVPATELERRTNDAGVFEWVCRTVPVNRRAEFFAITESNYWGESSFSQVAWTPALPSATNRSLYVR